MQGNNRDADTENRIVDTVQEGEGGMNRESSIETYTLPCVKQIAPVGICCMMQGAQTVGSVTTYSGGMGWEARGRFKREGTYVCLWLIHVDVY